MFGFMLGFVFLFSENVVFDLLRLMVYKNNFPANKSSYDVKSGKCL